MNTAVEVRTRPLRPGFGAEILDVDLRHADDATLEAVVRTFHRHGAIVLRGQTMTPGELTAFVARFGEPEDHTLKEFTVPGFPKVYRLSNRVVDGKPIGAHNDGIGWHTDYSYKAEPVMATMLYAVEVPAEGSDTLLADCVAAWNALTPERQAELEGLVLHHSYQYFMRTREYGARELSEQLKAEKIEIVEAGGQRGALRVTYRTGASTIVQSIRLWSNSARIASTESCGPFSAAIPANCAAALTQE